MSIVHAHLTQQPKTSIHNTTGFFDSVTKFCVCELKSYKQNPQKLPHIIAGRPNIKPSDILAMKSNYKGCAPYKPASSTAPSSPAAMMMATVEHTTVHAQNNINNLSKNVPSATTYSNNCNNSNNYALANNASAASVDVRNNQPQPKSTKSDNQSSSRKNRRIGRQESRYTSGNFVFLKYFFHFFSILFLLFVEIIHSSRKM